MKRQLTNVLAELENARVWHGRGLPQDNPVDQIRKTMPRGDGSWQGFDSVYVRLQTAAHKMAKTRFVFLSDEHLTTMAIMGCGHEETMKGELHRLLGRGFI